MVGKQLWQRYSTCRDPFIRSRGHKLTSFQFYNTFLSSHVCALLMAMLGGSWTYKLPYLDFPHQITSFLDKLCWLAFRTYLERSQHGFCLLTALIGCNISVYNMRSTHIVTSYLRLTLDFHPM